MRIYGKCITFNFSHWLIPIVESYWFAKIWTFYSACTFCRWCCCGFWFRKTSLVLYWFILPWIKSGKFWSSCIVVSQIPNLRFVFWKNFDRRLDFVLWLLPPFSIWCILSLIYAVLLHDRIFPLQLYNHEERLFDCFTDYLLDWHKC